MTSSCSARGRAATPPRSAPPSSACAPRSSRRSTGAASASTSAASRPRRCCATPSWRTSSTHEAKTFGIQRRGHLRLRRGVPAQPQGRRRPGQGRPLPDEEEQDHASTTAAAPSSTPHTLRVERRDDHVRQLHHRHRRDHPAAARHLAVGAGGDLRGADPHRGAAGQHHHRRARARSAWSSPTCCTTTASRSRSSSSSTGWCRWRTRRSPRSWPSATSGSASTC